MKFDLISVGTHEDSAGRSHLLNEKQLSEIVNNTNTYLDQGYRIPLTKSFSKGLNDLLLTLDKANTKFLLEGNTLKISVETNRLLSEDKLNVSINRLTNTIHQVSLGC